MENEVNAVSAHLRLQRAEVYESDGAGRVRVVLTARENTWLHSYDMQDIETADLTLVCAGLRGVLVPGDVYEVTIRRVEP